MGRIPGKGDRACDFFGFKALLFNIPCDLIGNRHHVAHGHTDVFHGCHTPIGYSAHGIDVFGDLFGGLFGLPGKVFDLGGDHGEPFASITGTGSLNRRIKGQQIGLTGNTADQIDNLFDAGGDFAQIIDRLGRLLGRPNRVLGNTALTFNPVGDRANGIGQPHGSIANRGCM